MWRPTVLVRLWKGGAVPAPCVPGTMCVCRSKIRPGSQPGPGVFDLAFVTADRLVLLHGQANVIQAIEQAVLVIGINIKRD